MSNDQGSYTAEFKIGEDLFSEQCSVNLDRIKKIGKGLDEQIRFVLPRANGSTNALYTVKKDHGGDACLVFVGKKIQEEVSCLQQGNQDP